MSVKSTPSSCSEEVIKVQSPDTEAHVFSSQSWGFAAQKQSKVLSGLTASRLVNTQAANQEVSGLHLGTGTPFPQDSASKSCFQRISVGSLEEITHTQRQQQHVYSEHGAQCYWSRNCWQIFSPQNIDSNPAVTTSNQKIRRYSWF